MTDKTWDRTQDTNWNAVDAYIAENFLDDDPALDAALAASAAAAVSLRTLVGMLAPLHYRGLREARRPGIRNAASCEQWPHRDAR